LKRKSKTLVLKKKNESTDKAKKQGKAKKSEKLLGKKRNHKATTKNTKTVKKAGSKTQAKVKQAV
jgi:hypothetical protein